MILLALDLSTKSTGYAFFKDGKILEYGCFTQNSKNVLNRIDSITEEIKNIITKYKIDKIVAEEVLPESVGNNQKTYKALIYLQAAVALMVNRELGIEIEFIGASSWRSKLGIHTGRGLRRDTLKEADINYARTHCGIADLINDDEADAICIGLAFSQEGTAASSFNWE